MSAKHYCQHWLSQRTFLVNQYPDFKDGIYYECYLYMLIIFFSFNFCCHSVFEGLEGRLKSLLPVKLSAIFRLSPLPISDPGYQVKSIPSLSWQLNLIYRFDPLQTTGKAATTLTYDCTHLNLRFVFWDLDASFQPKENRTWINNI